MIFGLVFCPLSYPKRNDIGGGTRCIDARKMTATCPTVLSSGLNHRGTVLIPFVQLTKIEIMFRILQDI